MLFLRLFLVLLAFASVAESAEPYRIQPGDMLDVSVWQDEKLNRQLLVSPDGMISFPLVGHLQAGGATVKEVERALIRGLQKEFETEVNVTVALARLKDEGFNRTIYVTGEVNKPGQFAMSGPTTVLQAIALSGGLSPYAAEKRIQIHRMLAQGEAVYSFNYNQYRRGKDVSGNIYLEPGDVVVVPEGGLFE